MTESNNTDNSLISTAKDHGEQNRKPIAGKKLVFIVLAVVIFLWAFGYFIIPLLMPETTFPVQ